MAPPSQKGRFKPRKPAKKVAAPSAALPDATPSSTAATRRPRRPGRTGRGGRGRGRAPLPRGQVFFTGDEKSASTNNQDSAEQRGHKRSAIRNDEEIVATLEGGVGSTERKVDPSLAAPISDDKPAVGLFEEADPKIGTGPIYYDSDSTAEEEEQKKKAAHTDVHPESKPITLPYTGDRSHPETRFNSKLMEQNDSDDWFLVQLPTRLPKVALNKSEDTEKDDNTAEDDGIPGGGLSQTAFVATKPILTTAFDNSLANAKPGRFGKIKVYKSGRSELVLSNGVKLDLVEGLTCSFEQHAVSIDVNEGKFVPFGKVNMTVTATPNVNEPAAWGESSTP